MCCAELKMLLEANDKDDCFDHSHAAHEGGKRFVFTNTGDKIICRVRVDDCLITGHEKRCDFLFKICELEKYYLVEFKGVKVEDGVGQIINTYTIVNKKIKTLPQNYSGIIVSSSVPAATQQRFRQLQEKCYREKGFRIRKTHWQHEEPI
jgi:hypothetical protein